MSSDRTLQAQRDLVGLGEPRNVLLDDLDLLRSGKDRDGLHGKQTPPCAPPGWVLLSFRAIVPRPADGRYHPPRMNTRGTSTPGAGSSRKLRA